jgi:hypothetical protein
VVGSSGSVFSTDGDVARHVRVGAATLKRLLTDGFDWLRAVRILKVPMGKPDDKLPSTPTT